VKIKPVEMEAKHPFCLLICHLHVCSFNTSEIVRIEGGMLLVKTSEIVRVESGSRKINQSQY